MSTIKITATIPAWLPSFNSIDDLMAAVRKEDNVCVMDMATFTTCDMGRGSNPYTHIGEAEITLTLNTHGEMVSAQVAALQKELEAERAESMCKQNAILDRISKLSALTMDEA